jgi:hypothetical protein
MKNDRPGSRITSANDSGRPVIPLENHSCTLSIGGVRLLDAARPEVENPTHGTTFEDPKPATSALRLGAPDAQKQSSMTVSPEHNRGAPQLRIVGTLMKINRQQLGR